MEEVVTCLATAFSWAFPLKLNLVLDFLLVTLEVFSLYAHLESSKDEHLI